MDYNELREVIKQVKKIVPCTHCNKRFTNDAIKILSIFNDEILFHFTCANCYNQLAVQVSLSDVDDGKKIPQQEERKTRLSIHAKDAKLISHNDVLDIHNFLDHFKGDFRKLFSINKK